MMMNSGGEGVCNVYIVGFMLSLADPLLISLALSAYGWMR